MYDVKPFVQNIDTQFRINATDTAAICGVSKWSTPYQVWLKKTNRTEKKEIDPILAKKGKYLEPAILSWFSDESSKEVVPHNPDILLRSSEHPWMTGKPDATTDNGLACVEAKTAMSAEGWGETGSHQMPIEYLCQIAHYRMMMNYTCVYLSVLIRGMDFRYYIYEKDDELEGLILEKQKEFYNFLINDEAPLLSGKLDMLLYLAGSSKRTNAIATFEICDKIDKYNMVKNQIKELDSQKKELADDICLFMGENEMLIDPAGNQTLATWKPSSPIKRFDSKKLKEDDPVLYDKYVIESKPQRRLLIKESKV